jgi:hypothetical protein
MPRRVGGTSGATCARSTLDLPGGSSILVDIMPCAFSLRPRRLPRHLGPIALAALPPLLLASRAASAQCPKLTVQVDYDIPGSGYSEVKPENWETNTTYACYKAYRSLTQHAGDGTRKGKAIWRPAIPRSGWWQVDTSWRQSDNRGTDADYFFRDDLGKQTHKVVDQRNEGSGCSHKDMGTFWCKAGGGCELVLDGDDGQSYAADITTFTLVQCDDAPDAGPDAGPGPCAPIAAHTSWELCAESATSCAGVFNDGAGCKALCAAAGMVCTARFGASSPCKKEPQTPIPCEASNGHQSDWCECAYPDGGGPAADTGAPGEGGGGAGAGGASGHGGGAGGTLDGSQGGSGAGGAATGDGSVLDTGAGGEAARSGGAPAFVDAPPETGGCGCRARGRSGPTRPWAGVFGVVALLVVRRARSSCPHGRAASTPTANRRAASCERQPSRRSG